MPSEIAVAAPVADPMKPRTRKASEASVTAMLPLAGDIMRVLIAVAVAVVVAEMLPEP